VRGGKALVSEASREQVASPQGDDLGPQYTNFGIFDGPVTSDVLNTWVDTWYYVAAGEIGRMALGAGPLAGVTEAAAFLAGHLAFFDAACAPLLRTRQHAFLGYKFAAEPIRVYTELVGISSLRQGLRARELPPSAILMGATVSLDAFLAVRTPGQGIVGRWMREVGTVSFYARPGARPLGAITEATRAPWTATLTLDVASIFRPDNAAFLERARERWRRWVEAHPGSGRIEDEGEYVGVVTLAAPPPDTPGDNEQLAALNAPALRAAIATWERTIGGSFEWSDE